MAINPFDPNQVAQSFVQPQTPPTASRLGPLGDIARGWRRNAPGPLDLMMLNSWRTKNTILGGPWGDEARGNMANYVFNPRSWIRYPTTAAFSPSSKIGGLGGEYNPYGMAPAVNWIGKKVTPKGRSLVDGDRYYSGGLFGQISAANAVGRKGATDSTRENIINFFNSNNSDNRFLLPGDAPANLSRQGASQLILDSGGALNRSVGGFLHGARYGVGDTGVGWLSSSQFSAAAARGARWAGYGTSDNSSRSIYRAYQAGKEERIGAELMGKTISDDQAVKEIGGKAIRKAGRSAAMKYGTTVGVDILARSASLLEGVGIATTLWDIGKFGYGAVKPLGRDVAEGVSSITSNFRKPIFGYGFRDNDVSRTARSRGVAAIQNSRLNARNVLGNEAYGVAQRFG